MYRDFVSGCLNGCNSLNEQFDPQNSFQMGERCITYESLIYHHEALYGHLLNDFILEVPILKGFIYCVPPI